MLSNDILRELEKRGRVQGPDSKGEYVAYCPFHPDREHPNLHINPQRGFHCFACYEKGSIGKLAKDLGVEIPSQRLTASTVAQFLQSMPLPPISGKVEIPYEFQLAKPGGINDKKEI